MTITQDLVQESDLLREQSAGAKLYAAGPMSGYEDYNAPAFRGVALWLRQLGFDVLSPVEMDEEQGFDHGKLNGKPDEHEYDAEYFDFLRRDILRIITDGVTAIVVLEGWEDSRGAAAEVELARQLGYPVYSAVDCMRVKRPTSYRPASEETVLEEAQRLVGGERNRVYDHPLADFTKTAKIMSAVLDKDLKPGHEVRPDQIPLLMIGVKLSRLVATPDHRDSLTDICGYARTLEMVWEKEGEE